MTTPLGFGVDRAQERNCDAHTISSKVGGAPWERENTGSGPSSAVQAWWGATASDALPRRRCSRNACFRGTGPAAAAEVFTHLETWLKRQGYQS